MTPGVKEGECVNIHTGNLPPLPLHHPFHYSFKCDLC
jgi:hypothetical protein